MPPGKLRRMALFLLSCTLVTYSNQSGEEFFLRDLRKAVLISDRNFV